MKKCPKCGTVLDDSKKTCYMCGTVLNDNSPLNFGETFDNQIGATVTKGQDNVFNTVDSFNQKPNQNGFDTFQSSNSTNMFKDQFNSLNSIRYDERTALEKIFSDDSRFKSKDELNAMSKNMPQNNQNNNTKGKGVNTAPVQKPNNGPLPPPNNMVNNVPNNVPRNVPNNVPNNMPNNVVKQPMNVNPPQFNAQINWGDNLRATNKKVKFNLSLTAIFNIISFVLFIAAMVFVYFSYFKPKQDATIEFGGLVYSINDEFILKKDDTFSRYYTKGENCTISINYGKTNDVDGFITRYLEEAKANYDSLDGYTTSTGELKINGNSWQELNIIKLVENPSGTGGYSTSTKFKYVAIVYKGTYYDIRYANMDDDGTCSASYDSFINSLAFTEEE